MAWELEDALQFPIVDSVYNAFRRNWSLWLLLVEFALDCFFIWVSTEWETVDRKQPLHPIDYPTYLAQIRLIWTEKTLDYGKLHGPTGPLVYPAGHVIIYAFYERLFGVKEDPGWTSYTSAQITFIPVQLLVTLVVHRIYSLVSPQPHLDCLFFLFAVRCRNVFVNGMFNDAWEVLFAYTGVLLLLQQRTNPKYVILAFSIAVSIKMNAILWAPGVAFHYINQIGWKKTIAATDWAVAWQIVIALPFLYGSAHNYITRSFELSRTFFWAISVSWKFVPKTIFESFGFRALLQILQISAISVALWRQRKIYHQQQLPDSKGAKSNVPTQQIATLLISTHFAGLMFARSLHYSFYLWYFHTIPLLLRAARFNWPVRIGFAITLEIAWNQWQQYKGNTLDSCATWHGSLTMFSLHLWLLHRLYENANTTQ